MKRFALGSLWFVVIFIGMYLVYSFGLGIYISSVNHAQGIQNGYQAGIEFGRVHRSFVLAAPLAILVLAIALATIGTKKGILPGTKKKLH